ncbi:MAG: 23S rRNA (adenine(2503)-C(2))-methyltransferase RlmN [Dehalococcoidia bacterium]|nr:23S rRNA (adenine(2503)-C(2))-methyltransferase RlmN [Dehalococcoidia bacterium]
MQATSICLTDLTPVQIGELVKTMGEPDYRAAQLRHWIYRELARSFDDMTDLPKPFRSYLTRETRLRSIDPVYQVEGRDGTVKALFALADGRHIESVLMSYRSGRGRPRYTVCVSTQVGCPIGCPFCATGQQGFERNLTQGEIIDQVLYLAHVARERCGAANNASSESAGYITNIVLMGMGEPLANYTAVLKAIRMLISPQDFGIGARSIIISTAGLIPQIKQLSQERLQIGLAISLHASDNVLRSKLVPINEKYPLEQLLQACHEYYNASHRRVSFEYVLFEGINDSVSQAHSLAGLLMGLNCHVNLIPANDTADDCFRSPPRGRVQAFERELQHLHINCTVRQRKGLDIDAGCGQLRSRLQGKSLKD